MGTFRALIPSLAAAVLACLPAPGRAADYGDSTVYFEPNAGQFDPQVRFKTRVAGMSVFFTDDEAVMVLYKGRKPASPMPHRRPAETNVETAVVRMKLAGAVVPARTNGLETLPGVSNYFIGQDALRWHTDIPNYARIRYESVYSGVDLVAYGNGSQLEYDFEVAPGADPGRIRLGWEGVERMSLNSSGDLVLSTPLGDIVQKRPRVYQEINGRRVPIASNYILGSRGQVQFALARYDRRRPLVIDPVTLVYASFLGLSAEGQTIAVDSTGAAYVAGYTYDTNFPTKSAYQTKNKSALYGSCGDSTTFVAKFAATGSSLVYSTYLGGTCDDHPNGIAVDSSGAAYIVGTANSSDFPTYAAVQSTCGNDYEGVYVTKLAPAGNALAYSTYLCGGHADDGGGIAVDSSGAAYVTGMTASGNWPLHSAYNPVWNGSQEAFVTKLSATGNSLVYSTYLGGSGNEGGTGIAVDSTGAAYVVGWSSDNNFPLVNPFQSTNRNLEGSANVFVTKFSPAGTSLVYSTYLGGNGGSTGAGELPTGIAVDAGQAAFVTGVTYSTNFPLLNAYQSTNKNQVAGTCFVTKFATAGNSLIYSTYLGGSVSSAATGDVCNGISVNSAKEAYVAGQTYSANFPVLSPLQASLGQNSYLAFVTKFTATGGLSFSTYLGGSNGNAKADAIALDGLGGVYVTGFASSPDFPTTGAYQKTTSTSGGPFVAKLQDPTSTSTVVNTSPDGFTFTVDGTSYTAAQSFTWTAGTTHTIAVTSPQTLASVAGTRYAWSNWSDSGAQSHTITASSSGGTFTATFSPSAYLLTATASPAADGKVTANPTSADGYYNSGTSVQLTAAANSGYRFVNWTGDLSGATNPQTVSMTTTHSVTANFSANTVSPSLTITKTHTGKFAQGQTNAAYTITVSNQASAGPTSGTVTVTDTIPAYLTLTGMSGTGWSCSGNSCTRSDVLAGGSSYPPITVTVNVAPNAPSQVTNFASVSGGGSNGASASDVTTTQNNQPPANSSVSPFAGSGNQTFTVGFSDTNGGANIVHAYLMVNVQEWVASSCYVDYNVGANTISLMNDAGTAWLGPIAAGSSASLSNSQCTVYASGASASAQGNNLTLNVPLSFQASYAGGTPEKRIFVMATDYAGLTSPWMPFGIWYPSPLTGSLITRYRLYFPVTKEHLYTTDLNEYNVLGTQGWQQEGADASVFNGPASVSGMATVPFWRLYYTTNMTHFWTTDRNEYLTLMTGYGGAFTGEGADEFLLPGQIGRDIPVYRLLFNGGGPPIHFWTTDPHEDSVLCSAGGGWTSEGIPGYLYPPGTVTPSAIPAVQSSLAPAVHDHSDRPKAMRFTGTVTIGAVVNAASLQAGPIAAGEAIRLLGSFPPGVQPRVLVGSAEAQVISADEGQIGAIVPAGTTGIDIPVTVIAGGRRSSALAVEVVEAAPAVFATDPYGRGLAQATNEDGTANSTDNPAEAGSVVTLSITGDGGKPIAVWIGGLPAPVVSQNPDPRSGTVHLRVRVPGGLPAEQVQRLVVKAGEFFSQSGVMLATR